MFWRMAGLSTASPVEAILDKDEFTLEELLDEDEIIQECKALNGRLINFLRERAKVKQLVQYIVKEPPEGAEKQRTFKFPFIACEIFTCEVDIILKALIEDEELMDLLFSFLEPERPHGALLAGYFGKVVVCLSLRKTTPLMNYIQVHQDIIRRLVNLIGITSIMEVLIRLIGADEHIYANCSDSMQWIEDMNVLELIVEKFSSSDCPEVHANAAETLCAITRSAPPALASKISSPSFIERLFQHALEDLRPKSELVNLLSVCISLLDPKRYASGTYYMYTRQMTHGSGTAASPETVKGMLDVLGDLLKLLDISSEDHVLLTTYGKLQPPLGKHRLKPTIPVEGRKPPRIGNIGHLTRIANKLVQLGNSNSDIQTFLQENSDWADWETDILLNRNAVENVFQWACGRPTALQDRNRDSDDDDYQDRDYDLAALANNLSQAFRYGIYSNDDIEEAHGSMERDGEDIYFDDESAEVVISSLRLGGDDQESGSLFTNPKWFAFEEERNAHEHSTASSSPNTEGHDGIGGADNVIVEEDEDLADTAASGPSEQKSDDVDDMPRKLSEGLRQNEMCASYKPPEWVEWRESSDALEDPPPLDTANVSDASQLPSLPNGKLPVELDQPDKTAASRVTTDEPADSCKTESEGSPTYPSLSTEVPEGNQSTENILDPHSGIDVFSGILEHEKVN